MLIKRKLSFIFLTGMVEYHASEGILPECVDLYSLFLANPSICASTDDILKLQDD